MASKAGSPSLRRFATRGGSIPFVDTMRERQQLVVSERRVEYLPREKVPKGGGIESFLIAASPGKTSYKLNRTPLDFFFVFLYLLLLGCGSAVKVTFAVCRGGGGVNTRHHLSLFSCGEIRESKLETQGFKKG